MLVSLAQTERLLRLRGIVVGRKDFVSIAEARHMAGECKKHPAEASGKAGKAEPASNPSKELKK
jgi:hypothetical protein